MGNFAVLGTVCSQSVYNSINPVVSVVSVVAHFLASVPRQQDTSRKDLHPGDCLIRTHMSEQLWINEVTSSVSNVVPTVRLHTLSRLASQTLKMANAVKSST